MGYLGNELAWKASLDVRLTDDRQDTLVDEAPDAVADGALVL
jgi:hypothetical protein